MWKLQDFFFIYAQTGLEPQAAGKSSNHALTSTGWKVTKSKASRAVDPKHLDWDLGPILDSNYMILRFAQFNDEFCATQS